MATTLLNGIVWPDHWPLKDMDMGNSRPQPVPYLESPPEVVNISVGRQLFVDDFLLENPVDSMCRVDHKPVKHPGNPVLWPESAEERHRDFPPCAVAKCGGVWHDDADDLFKMWYMTGYAGYLALATSKDGVHWERPQLDVVPGTNLVLPKEIHPDSGSVIIDHESSEQRYKMMRRGGGGNYPGVLMVSADGIHWNEVGKTGGVDDRSTIFYNPLRKKWVQSIRLGVPKSLRSRFYFEADDFLSSGNFTRETMIPWMRADNLDRGQYSPAQLYNFDAIAYESIMIGFHQILLGPPNNIIELTGWPKLTEVALGTSRDGFHWYRPDREPFLPARREYGSWEYGYVESSAGMCLIVGDELWFYYSAYAGEPDRPKDVLHSELGSYGNGAMGLARMRRDGFSSMRPMFPQAITQTKKLLFSGSTLFVNASTSGSMLTVQAIDEQGNPIPGLEHKDCLGFVGNSTRIPIRWREKDLSGLGTSRIRLQFRMDRGDLYAFWITDDPTGRSGGFTGAGGPGIRGARDI